MRPGKIVLIICTLTILGGFSIYIALNAKENSSDELLNKRFAEISVPMHDGTLLATDVFLPKRKGKGAYPVVLVRTPYNKAAEKWLGKAFGFFGIAVVTQDCRGKYGSGGDFYPFINERSDGLSTLRWIRGQEWSNGIVAGWGSSYVGYTQWALSDSLDFLSLLVTSADIYEFTYPDESFSLQSAFVWGFQNAAGNAHAVSADSLNAGMRMLPLSTADDSTVKDIPFINDWLAHETYDQYWAAINHRSIARAPVISMAGWYDIFLKAQLNDFLYLVQHNDSESRLIIGPWCHGSMAEASDYGGLKKTGKPQKVFRYVKNSLKGRKNKLTSPLHNSRYNLFIMERNEYVGSDVWPPEGTELTPYYLGPDKYIGTDKFTNNGSLEYVYDPADPFPSHGGTALGDGVGPARQNENMDREDQVVFVREVNEEALILLGPVSAHLYLGSSAACTDFVVQLQDVFPDGKIINIQEGIAHVSCSEERPTETDISVWATGYQLNPGHALRVLITSSWFPRFNRNLNTCEPISNAVNMIKAAQKIYYGPDTPSYILLPIYQMD